MLTLNFFLLQLYNVQTSCCTLRTRFLIDFTFFSLFFYRATHSHENQGHMPLSYFRAFGRFYPLGAVGFLNVKKGTNLQMLVSAFFNCAFRLHLQLLFLFLLSAPLFFEWQETRMAQQSFFKGPFVTAPVVFPACEGAWRPPSHVPREAPADAAEHVRE